MLRMLIKNSEDVVTNANTLVSEDALNEWYEYNKDYFPFPHTKEIISLAEQQQESLRDQESDEAIELGTKLIKKIRSINRRKLKTALWDQNKFNALLTSQTAAQIERALWNGSLTTASYLLTGMSDFYSDIEITSIITPMTEHEEKWKNLI